MIFLYILIVALLIWIGYVLGIMSSGYSEPKNNAKSYCVYDYSKPVSRRKIASYVTLKKASRLYWKNPGKRTVYLEF